MTQHQCNLLGFHSLLGGISSNRSVNSLGGSSSPYFFPDYFLYRILRFVIFELQPVPLFPLN